LNLPPILTVMVVKLVVIPTGLDASFQEQIRSGHHLFLYHRRCQVQGRNTTARNVTGDRKRSEDGVSWGEWVYHRKTDALCMKESNEWLMNDGNLMNRNLLLFVQHHVNLFTEGFDFVEQFCLFCCPFHSHGSPATGFLKSLV